jgi:hypothetical protein
MVTKYFLIIIFLLKCSIPVDHNNVFDPANKNSIFPVIALNTTKAGGSTTPPGNYTYCTVTNPTAGTYYSCSTAVFTTLAICKANSSCTACSSLTLTNSTSTYYQCGLKSSLYSTYSTCFTECK